MKLFYDLFRRLFVRLAILLIVAITLIVFEAKKQSDALASEKEASLHHQISAINKIITANNLQLTTKTKEKSRIENQIATKTRKINEINKTLQKSRNEKKLRKKLKPKEFAIYSHDLIKLTIERATLAVDYSRIMFSIVDINKQLVALSISKSELINQRVILQSSHYIDLILAEDSPASLLTQADRILLLTIFYILFFGALTLKVINFYLIAPLARKASHITITSNVTYTDDSIHYGTPEKEFTLQLETNNNLIVKPGWYSFNTDGITRTRFFWQLSNPFSCYAMGLVNMTEFIPDTDHSRHIKIAAESDPNHEIIPLHLDNHPGYIIKHGHVVATSGNHLMMKKIWGIGDWRNWLFGNLRYVFFTGSGTVYVHGYGKVSTNNTDNPDNRIKERHLIGYDTQTPFRMVRTETFINYWLNGSPLYDIQFANRGRFLQQQSYGQHDEKIFRSALEDILAAIGKLLGF